MQPIGNAAKLTPANNNCASATSKQSQRFMFQSKSNNAATFCGLKAQHKPRVNDCEVSSVTADQQAANSSSSKKNNKSANNNSH